MKENRLKRIYNLYADGFRTLQPYSRALWIIIMLKLFIMFFVLKLFFFRDTLKNQFESDEERASHVIEQLTNSNK